MKKLLVIGNGFDLSINAKTAYSNYFESEWYRVKREEVSEWIQRCSLESMTANVSVPIEKDNCNISCWDLLFCMESQENEALRGNAKWCDVERVIHDSLLAKSRTKEKFSWQHVFLILNNYYDN